MRLPKILFLALMCHFLTIQLANAQQATFIPHKDCGWKQMTDHHIEQNPEHAAELEKYLNKTIPQLVQNGLAEDKSVATILNIPVVVHVIHNGEAIGTGANLSIEQIQAQLDVLNEDFSATNPNFGETPSAWASATGNPEIQFCLAAFDEDGNGTSGVTRHNIEVTGSDIEDSNIEDGIKPATVWDTEKYYNIWTLSIPGTTAQGGTVGYAYLPTIFAVGENFDGTVVDHHWFGGPGFNQSGYKTLTHETGHYLGLPHTFNGDSCSDDDNISDTPNVEGATSSYIPNLSCSSGNFPTGPSSCGNAHMYVNYMDYVNSDYCYTSFTNGQIALMRSVLNGTSNVSNYGSRNMLLTHVTTACTFFENDAGIGDVINPVADQQCSSGDITPEVKLTNFGTDNLNSVTIKYEINNGTPVSFNWTGNLTSGNSINITLATYSPPMGTYTFNVYTENPNGMTDAATANDASLVNSMLITPSDLPLLEDFANANFDPTNNGIETLNPSSDAFVWERSANVSAYGNGSGAALFNNYDGSNASNPFNTTDALITPVYDFSSTNGALLTFDVAYAAWSNGSNFFADSLIVLVSTDCGNTYNDLIYKDGGNSLSTAAATSSRFVPTANQWKTVELDLSNYNNANNFSIAFVNFSGWGNQLFLDNIQINVACELTATGVGTSPSCYDQCNGSAFVEVSGGTMPYSYIWNANAGGSVSDILWQACPGTYSVTVSDANGCSAIATADIEPIAQIEINLVTTDETLPNASDGTITASASGGTPPYNYSWNDGSNANVLINLPFGPYILTLTDSNGCIATAQANIQAGSADCSSFEAAVAASSVTCAGEIDGTAQVTVANGMPPYSYFWSNGSTENMATDLSAGIIIVTVTDAFGCNFIAEDLVTSPEALSVSIQSSDETIVGQNDGTAQAIIVGGTAGYAYLWSNGATTYQITNLAPGMYQLTVTDQNNCIATSGVEIGIGGPDCSQLVGIANKEDVSCFGENNGSATIMASGGAPPYAYFWNDGHVGAIYEGLSAGSYWVTTTDNNQCFTINQVNISEPAELALMVVGVDESTVGANDGSATAVSDGGAPDYDFLWSTGATTASIENLSAGVYLVTVTDFNGCTNQGEVEIQVEFIDCSGLSNNAQTSNASCFGASDGSIFLDPSGGTPPYTYDWANGLTTSSSQNLPAGTYEIVVFDANQCAMEQVFTITEPAPISSNLIATNGICGLLGTASVNPQGGTPPYNFAWSTGATVPGIPIQNTGVYVLTITDAIGCEQVDEVAVNVSTELLAVETIDGGLDCFGDHDGFIELIVEGGKAPYTFSWNNGATTDHLENLEPGEYTVLVTDSDGCTFVETIAIEAPAVLAVSCIATEPTNGNNGVIETASTGGTAPYTFAWSNGASGVSIAGLAPAVYTVTLTDANDCISICSVDLMGSTSTNQLESISHLHIFPNPTKADLIIQATFDQAQEGSAQLYNVIGQKVDQFQISGATIDLKMDVSAHAAGSYWVIIETAEGRLARKVILLD